MDQQFQKYEHFFQGLWVRLNSWILPGVTGKVRVRLLIFCTTFLLVSLVPVLIVIPDTVEYYSVDKEYFWSVIFSYLFVALLPIGSILMLRRKKIGWIITSGWLIVRTLRGMEGLYYSRFWEKPEGLAFENLNDLMGFSWEKILPGVIIFGAAAAYIYSKEVRSELEVKRRAIIMSFAAALLIIMFGYGFSVIYENL